MKQSAVPTFGSPRTLPPQSASFPRQGPAPAWRWLLLVTLLAAAMPAHAAVERLRVVCDGAAADSVRYLLAGGEARLHGISATVLPAMAAADAADALAEGHVDVVITANPLPVAVGGPSLTTTTWVRTPIILAVHEQVPVTSIQLDELVAILAGWVNRWPDGTPVRLLLPPASSSDLDEVKSVSSGLSFGIDRALQRPGLTVIDSDEAIADRIEAVPGSIGFTSLGYVMSNEHRVKSLLIDGIEPSLANERVGLYRLQRVLNIFRRSDASPETAKFVAFLLAERHQSVLLSRGLKPVGVPIAFGD